MPINDKGEVYNDVEIVISRNKWQGFYLPMYIREELVSRYNQVGKRQELHTQKPVVTVRTYE